MKNLKTCDKNLLGACIITLMLVAISLLITLAHTSEKLEEETITEVSVQSELTFEKYSESQKLSASVAPVPLVFETSLVTDKPLPTYCVDFTNEELEMLTGIIHCEAHDSDELTKKRIASIVINRVKAEEFFPDTIKEVLEQKNQFSDSKHPVSRIYGCQCEECRQVALEILEQGSILPSDVQVYYNEWESNNWVNTRQTYDTYNGIVYAYIYPK